MGVGIVLEPPHWLHGPLSIYLTGIRELVAVAAGLECTLTGLIVRPCARAEQGFCVARLVTVFLLSSPNVLAKHR